MILTNISMSIRFEDPEAFEEIKKKHLLYCLSQPRNNSFIFSYFKLLKKIPVKIDF